MSATEVISFSPFAGVSDAFSRDSLLLFSGLASGNMEKWEYGPRMYKDDPAAGSVFWDQLVKKPQEYYPALGDVETIRSFASDGRFANFFSSIETLVELGPGCKSSIEAKTFPLLAALTNARTYVPVDSSRHLAEMAARFISRKWSLRTCPISADFTAAPLRKLWRGKSATVMWGISMGNFPGHVGSDCFPHLEGFLTIMAASLSDGDIFIGSFDTEMDARRIVKAYSEPNIRRQALSVLHRMQRDGIVRGKFNPELWHHEAVWVPETSQCARLVYPLVDQHIWIDRYEFPIPSRKEYVTTNSYKYAPETILSAVDQAGFSEARIFQRNAIALLIATK
ncbi:MAG: hypothetical protein EOM26_10020 [Alphaproteobacteria bacterium]|nr:hypothetical protein [Alphaproteobacteria bacterium]